MYTAKYLPQNVALPFQLFISTRVSVPFLSWFGIKKYLNVARWHSQKCALAQEIWLGSPDRVSPCEGVMGSGDKTNSWLELSYQLFAGFKLHLSSEVWASCSFLRGHFWTAIEIPKLNSRYSALYGRFYLQVEKLYIAGGSTGDKIYCKKFFSL